MNPPAPVRFPDAAGCVLVAVIISAACGPGCDSPRATPPANPTVPGLTAPARGFSISFTGDPDDPHSIEISVSAVGPVFAAVDPGTARRLLTVSLVDDSDPDRAAVPLLGNWEVKSPSRLILRPAFPLIAGERYRVRFDPGVLGTSSGQPIEQVFEVASVKPAAAPRVEAIYPSGEMLPANHLKFYIVFSEPMRQGDIWQHFRLIDVESGKPVPRPFRHTQLWSADDRRLTLWFHPGRVKRGVNLNVEIGPILREGRDYRLEISGGWTSSRGTPLGADVTRRFRAGPPDRAQPDPSAWTLELPPAGSTQPLRVIFGEPLDWALLLSDVGVVDAEGRRLAGTIATERQETAWTFTPRNAWQPGTCRLAVSRILEDLAGNSVERPFEVDVTGKPVPSVPETVYRAFTIDRRSSETR